ncbi:uncharacterized protein MJAP1_004298 [Malassezia japonica]|uniref:MMS19 nucleotide excision repair protein n=1 Tax=Malassezia japonica TaxID=223818 RepID=A0AAF0F1W0_9BASI|nr:uncharacterized protein MJAP1_004298 [Malassezia japonica]WFD41301.1 hypothetical protein MJAP1_004298 [Malassezia japonica]
MEAAIGAYVRGTYEEVPPSVLADVSEERVSLLELVKAIGPHLTSENDAERTMAVSLLSRVVSHLAAQGPHPQLTKQIIRTLTAFFSEKLSDASALADAASRLGNDATLVPASAPRAATAAAEQRTLAQSQMLVDCLDALLALSGVGFAKDQVVDRNHFGGEEARVVSDALFSSLELRAHPQTLRYTAVRLLDSLVARNRAGLAAMRTVDGERGPPGSAFVQGYTKLVAGEKDPRVLLIHFGLARVLLLEWEMEKAQVEAFFNVIFCYFPITFRPPPDDPYHITPEMLKDALRACISASPAFAPMAMPLLLEKLSASGGSAKVDVLHTLNNALPVYGRAATEANADDVWAFLKLDILQATDDESAQWAQTTLTTMLRILYADAEPQGMANVVLDECTNELKEPSKSLAKTCMKIVQSLIDATPATSAMALKAVLTLLLGKLEEGDEDETHILALLAALLDLVQRVYTGESQRTYDSDGRPLDAFHDTLFSALTRGLERRADVAALHGLVMLVQVPGFLRADEVDYATRCIQTVLLAPEADDALREAALAGLDRILSASKRSIEEHTLPFLLEQLPYTLPAEADLFRIRLALGALARLCTAPDLFDAFVVRVCALLASACGAQRADARTVGYACALLATLQVCLEKKLAAQHTDIPKYAASLPLRLVNLLKGAQSDRVAADVAVVQYTCEILAVLVPTLSAERQETILRECLAALSACAPVPRADAPETDANLIGVVAALIVGAKRQAALPSGDALSWIEATHAFLVDRPDRAGDTFESQSAYFLLCALANKYADVAQLEAKLDALWAPLVSTRALPRRIQGVYAWVWLARGLLARGSDVGAAMLDRLQRELFGDATLGAAAAGALRVLATHDELLSKANGFQLRLLYKQRLLDRLFPEFVAGYRKGGAEQTTYLIALATLLPALPEATLVDKVIALLPLLVHTLSIPDANARASAANALHAALAQVPERLEPDDPPSALAAALDEHLATLIPHLVANVTPGPYSPPRTRTAAFQVLSALVPRIVHDTLVPYRRTVVQALGVAAQGVDDPRRTVRVHAVDCRDVWYRINVLE